MTYGDGQEPKLLVNISFDFYTDITPHMLATDVAVVGTVGVRQQGSELGMPELTAMGTTP